MAESVTDEERLMPLIAELSDALELPEQRTAFDANEAFALVLLWLHQFLPEGLMKVKANRGEKPEAWLDIGLMVVEAFPELRVQYLGTNVAPLLTVDVGEMSNEDAHPYLTSPVLDKRLVIPFDLKGDPASANYLRGLADQLAGLTYDVAIAVTEKLGLASEAPRLTQSEFMALSGLMYGQDGALGQILNDIDTAVVVFGVQGGAEVGVVSTPILTQIEGLWRFIGEFVATIEERVGDRGISPAGWSVLVRVLWELTVLTWTLESSNSFHVMLSYDKVPKALAAITTTFLKAATTSGLALRRAIASEYAGYALNRLAKDEEDPVPMFSAAMGAFEFSYLRQPGDSRLPKYIAQQMLEIGLACDAQHMIDTAESVWVDDYVLSHLLSFLLVDQGQAHKLRWGAVEHADKPRIPYAQIPPYSKEPRFIYEGRGRDIVAAEWPTYAADLWAASVILIQRFKETRLASEFGDPEPLAESVALYEQKDSGLTFPLWDAHPVGFAYLLAETLLNRQRTLGVHAGLQAPFPSNSAQADQLSVRVQRFMRMTKDPNYRDPSGFALNRFWRLFGSVAGQPEIAALWSLTDTSP